QGEEVTQSQPFRSDLLAVWDVAKMTAISRWRTEEAVLACMFDGPTARCYLDRKLIRTWDVEHPDRETVALLHVPRFEAHQSMYSFLTDGRFAMQWRDGEGMTLHVYDRGGGLERRRLRLWATEMYGKPTARYQGQGTTAYGPDGLRFDLADNCGLPPLEGRSSFHLSNLLPIESRTFIAGRAIDAEATRGHLWESITGRIIADLRRQVPNWDRAVLSPDGRFLASTAED